MPATVIYDSIGVDGEMNKKIRERYDQFCGWQIPKPFGVHQMLDSHYL